MCVSRQMTVFCLNCKSSKNNINQILSYLTYVRFLFDTPRNFYTVKSYDYDRHFVEFIISLLGKYFSHLYILHYVNLFRLIEQLNVIKWQLLPQ